MGILLLIKLENKSFQNWIKQKHLLAIRLRESGLNIESKLGKDLLDKNKKIVEELEKSGELDYPLAFGGRRRKSRRKRKSRRNKSRIRR
jgi:hypothetical protein